LTHIATTHAGSLIRPDDLLPYLRAQAADEPYDTDAYEEQLDRSVRDVVERQATVGIDIVSDGEFPKAISWARYIQSRVSGFEYQERNSHDAASSANIVPKGGDRSQFPEFYEEYDRTQGMTQSKGRWVCVGPVHYVGQESVKRDVDRLKRALEGFDETAGFFPAVGPVSALSAGPAGALNEHYDSMQELQYAMADALREEYKAIVDAGFVVQIDDPMLANWYDAMGAPSDMGDYRRWFAEQVELINYAVRGLPEEQVRFHMCWGSWHGPHVTDIPLREVVDLLLNINVGGYVIEGANPRHEHEWRVWCDVKIPEGRTLVAGVIAHTTNVVEHPDLVAERLTRLAGCVPEGHLIAGVDCGFAQGMFVRRVHPSIQWAKLRSLVEGARAASASLTRRAG
jgi:5-methyltetrahydropteroyltriglutamate--homocysteine methyltransferase